MFKINKTYFELMFIFKECLNCWSCSDRKYAGGMFIYGLFFWEMFLVDFSYPVFGCGSALPELQLKILFGNKFRC